MNEPDIQGLTTFLTASKLVTSAQLREAQAEVNNPRDTEELLLALERKGSLTAFQTEKLRKGDRHGFFFGNFRILYKIDSGSFARVYRADEPSTGRVVAIKVLRNRWLDRPEWVENFEREGRVGLSLRHPNIVELISVGKDTGSGQPFIIMEFVEGGNLRDILAIRGRFSQADGLKILEDIASALAYAYGRGLTHRDLKLSNVLISSSGTAKVVDFGLAQIFSNKFIADDDTQVARTVDYAGLEKATNAPLNDVRSDIYFAGCIAYELLSGRPPLPPTKNKLERMMRDRFLKVKPLEPRDLETPNPAVVQLVQTMMAVEPGKRFQTPAQLLEAIKQLRAETGGVPAGDASIRRATATVFIVESDERLQDAMRDKLKQIGYRVLISGDPGRALDRFNQQPFQILVVDAGTTRNEGLAALAKVMERAKAISYDCRGIVICAVDAPDVKLPYGFESRIKVLQRPINLGQLVKAVRESTPGPAAP